MRQPKWNQYEVALLIETYAMIDNKIITKKQAVSELSQLFRNYAIAHGNSIDKIYRNINGISMRLEELRYLFTNGKSGLKNTSYLFRDMVVMYQTNQKEFQRVLKVAERIYQEK